MNGLLLTTPRAWLRRHFVGRLPGVQMASPLQGKMILITGASSGIGEATAVAVAELGAIPILVARRAAELARIVEEIEKRGGRAFAHSCDLTDGPSVDRLLAQVLSEHDGVDVQVKAPKFAAYIASKTALDTFSRIAGRETYGDGVTFTNVRLSLVRTDMIGPTDVYRRKRAMTPEQAAAHVVRALEDRPLTISTMVGNVSEVANLVAPRLSDAISHAAAKRFPDSPAAARRA